MTFDQKPKGQGRNHEGLKRKPVWGRYKAPNRQVPGAVSDLGD